MPFDLKLPILAFYANRATNTHDAERDSVYVDLEQWRNQADSSTENRSQAVARIRDAMERNLKVLDLSGLSLRQIPPIPATLRGCLETIDLSDNLLESLPEDLPEQLGDNLKLLDVRCNLFTCSLHALKQALSNRGIDCLHDQYDAESEEVPYTPNDDGDPYNHMSFDDVIEAYKKIPHSDHPIWEPRPQRPWAEPLLHFLTMGMSAFQNWAQGNPVLGPRPEPRKRDLAVDDSSRRLFAFMNNATNREQIIDFMNRALDEWEQSPEYTVERDRSALAQGRALTAELEVTFSNSLSKELAAETLDYIKRNFDYRADTFNDHYSEKRGRDAGGPSSGGAQSVHEGAPNSMYESGSHRASDEISAFATSAGRSELEAQNVPLLTAALAGIAMTNRRAVAAAAAGATGVGIVGGGVAYGLYRRFMGDTAPNMPEIETQTVSLFDDDESHDDEVVAELEILPELEDLISTVPAAAESSADAARRRRSLSEAGQLTSTSNPKSSKPLANDTLGDSIREKLNFSKYDDNVAKHLGDIWEKVVAEIQDDKMARSFDYLSRFHAALISLASKDSDGAQNSKRRAHRGRIASEVSDKLRMGAIAEAENVREELKGIRDDQARVSNYLDNWQNRLGESKCRVIQMYRRAFDIMDLSGETYDLALNCYRSAVYQQPIDFLGGELIGKDKLYASAIKMVESSFPNILRSAMRGRKIDEFPRALEQAYRRTIRDHGDEIVRQIKKSNSLGPAEEASIEFHQVSKFHLAHLIVGYMENYSILKALKEHGDLRGKYSGYQAVLEAKKIGVELLIEKYGSFVGEFDDSEKANVYSMISVSDQVSDEAKSYLMKSASLAFHLFTKGNDVNLSEYAAWDASMLEEFRSAEQRQAYWQRLVYEPPEGYKPLNKIKKKSDCASSKEYYQQFVDYKKNSMDHDVGVSAYHGLLSLGLSDHEIAAAIPDKIVYCRGVRMFYHADKQIVDLLDKKHYRNPRNKFENFLNNGVDITGPIEFIRFGRNRILAVSEVGGEIVMHMFGPREIQSSDALKKIRDSRALLDKYGMVDFIPELEGRELIDNILKPLFGSRLDELMSVRERSRYRDVVRRGYPILYGDSDRTLRGYRGPMSRPLTGMGMLPIVEEAVKENIDRIVNSVKVTFDEKTFWDNILSFIPFYDEIYKSVNDPEHKLDFNSIMLDVVGVVLTIVPAVGPLTKLGKAGQEILQKAVLSNIGKGLTGKNFARGVLISLAKEAPALQKLGLKGLSHAAFAAADLISPIPPELLVSPAMRMTKNIRAYFEQQRHLNRKVPSSMGGRLPANDADHILINAVEDELEAFGQIATIAPSADKSITLRSSILTPGQTLEEVNALFHPLSRKQPSVMRAGEVAPYSFIDVCSTPRRVERSPQGNSGTNLLSCFPFAGRSARLAAGDISAIQGLGPRKWRDLPFDEKVLEPQMPLTFQGYRYDDRGGNPDKKAPVRMSAPVDLGPGKSNSDLNDFIAVRQGRDIVTYLGKRVLSGNPNVISVENGRSGTVAVKIPLSQVTVDKPLFVFSDNLSGCSMVYAVKGNYLYIYHAGIHSDELGKVNNWNTGREGVETIARSHEALTGEKVSQTAFDLNSLIEIFSGYDSAMITYSGGRGGKITNSAPNVYVFEYYGKEVDRNVAAMAEADLLVTVSGGKIRMEALSEEYHVKIDPRKSQEAIYRDFSVASSKRTVMSTGPMAAPVPRRPVPNASLQNDVSYELGFFSKIKLDLARRRSSIQKFDVEKNRFVDTDEYETVAVAGRAQLYNSRYPDNEMLYAELKQINHLYEELCELAGSYSGAGSNDVYENLYIGREMSEAAALVNLGGMEAEVFVTLKKGGYTGREQVIGVAQISELARDRSNDISELNVDFVLAHPYTIVNKYPDFREYVIDKLKISPSDLDKYQLKRSGVQTMYAGLDKITRVEDYSHVKRITAKAVNPIMANEWVKHGFVRKD
ncbi:cytotoxic necrotizing factor Rho-activating domain-containing protein [Burkholderia ubonensis]|uniref:cytotoxic necrotizing factor Rho-activating domain-containing protein n=1 Tax=Burkholderia ubonensis TaxID=101571 RepID=UPI000B16CB81|nr:cytotoxic necrotizing factor Rho-activating domain-containing protein [Burkholderia ubonensis]